VQKLIEAKAKGQKREAPAPKAAKGNVIDLILLCKKAWET
jgi:non-homologous end joining protein Ku